MIHKTSRILVFDGNQGSAVYYNNPNSDLDCNPFSNLTTVLGKERGGELDLNVNETTAKHFLNSFESQMNSFYLVSAKCQEATTNKTKLNHTFKSNHLTKMESDRMSPEILWNCQPASVLSSRLPFHQHNHQQHHQYGND